ncbi:hypothetical protein BDV34DRAFT_188925 [Aspergillus parasiticus]|uniref:Uncharacterized protein n=1 Tax=Aspergillus parasiticus TaxID=5067 RepID=A0A5N6DXN3_ASPPA|nr:hypothetical protein BDV34DRAFT_188925 [Aspergillus parasiticus]
MIAVMMSKRLPCRTCSRRDYASSCRFIRQAPPTSVNTQNTQLKQNIALTTALLSQKGETRLP